MPSTTGGVRMPGDHRGELVALVPQKALERAKTRLRSVLPREARMALSVAMLRHVLGVCRELEGVRSILLSAPPELRPIAEEFGVELLEGGVRGMRRDVTEASLGGPVSGRAALLFVSSDLPLLTVDDLRFLVNHWHSGADLVLARQVHGTRVLRAVATDRGRGGQGWDTALGEADGLGPSSEAALRRSHRAPQGPIAAGRRPTASLGRPAGAGRRPNPQRWLCRGPAGIACPHRVSRTGSRRRRFRCRQRCGERR